MTKIILVCIIFLALVPTTINASDLRLVNEINDIRLSDDKKTLIVEGWGFILNAQNYYNDSTHEYSLLLQGNNHNLEVKGRLRNISHTDTMYYVGSRYCNDREFLKDSLVCNNYYNNIGFIFEIPLSQMNMEENYQVSLSVNAKKAKLKKTTSVYFPNKEAITLNTKHQEYIIDSKLHNIGVKVLNDWILVRDKPHKQGKILKGNLKCSTDKSLYYRGGTVFKNVYDKVSVNNTTYYQLKGTVDGCYKSMSVIKEGDDYSPIWIASTFIEHIGEILTIKTREVNHAPQLVVGDDITIYVDDIFDVWEGVSAYDVEDGDLSEDIRIISNTFENKVGTYRIKYAVTDSFNETTVAQRNIIVLKRNHPPQIVAEDITLKRYSNYNPYDYAKAFDQDQNDISHLLVNLSNVDTSLLKKQEQCYEVVDSYNLKTRKCVWVNIIEEDRSFRFIQQKHLFFKENIPIQWKDKLDKLQEELDNEIIYDQLIMKK